MVVYDRARVCELRSTAPRATKEKAIPLTTRFDAQGLTRKR